MSYHDHLPVYRLAYSFIRDVNRCTNKFSKNFKFTLGAKLFDCSLSIIESIIKANQVASSKQNFIFEAISKIELVFVYIRIADDFKLITPHEFETMSIQLSKMLDQLKAWKKWDSEKNN